MIFWKRWTNLPADLYFDMEGDALENDGLEYLPRYLDFLFRRKRLNVALSRARCLAILVANPRLLETACNTVEQMGLINTLCRAYYAGM